jgi:hypothetical protein
VCFGMCCLVVVLLRTCVRVYVDVCVRFSLREWKIR